MKTLLLKTLLLMTVSIIVTIQGQSRVIFPEGRPYKLVGQFEFVNGAVVITKGQVVIEKWMLIQ